MSILLDNLGVAPEVQRFFYPHIHEDNYRLKFHFQQKEKLINTELYGFNRHKCVSGEGLWICANQDAPLIDKMYLCSSAMECIAFAQICQNKLNLESGNAFVAFGLYPQTEQIKVIQGLFPNVRNYYLISSSSLQDIALQCRVNSFLNARNTTLSYKRNQIDIANNRNDKFSIRDEKFSLNEFLRISGQKRRLRIFTPKKLYHTFLEMLNRHRVI